MTKFTTPDGDPLHEFNTCHSPAGSPSGGQFCASDSPDEAFNRANPHANQGEGTVIYNRAKELTSELLKGGKTAQQARKELALYPDGSSMHTYVDEMLAEHKMRRRLKGFSDATASMGKGGGPTIYDRKTKRIQGQRLRKKGY